MRTGFITASSLSTSAEYDFADLSFLRCKSFAGLRAFMCPVDSESCASRDRLHSIVVTPDRIPQFTIPKLAVEEHYRDSVKDMETQPGKHTENPTNPLHLSSPCVSPSSSSSPSSLFSSLPALGRKAQRSVSNPDNCRWRCSPVESDQCSDPATRGALSLPHLAKITTPYGFVTLSQSPQMAKEEELFLQTGYRFRAGDKNNMHLRDLRAEKKGSSTGRMLPVQHHTNADSHQVSRGISNSSASMCSGSRLSSATATRPKQSFWGVLHKKLSNRKLTMSI